MSRTKLDLDMVNNALAVAVTLVGMNPDFDWALEPLEDLRLDVERRRRARNRDRVYARGQKHPNSKLTDADRAMIRELHHVHGLSYSTLADKFEVSKRTIARIVKRVS